MEINITSEQRRFYHENGYLALDAITTPEDVGSVRAAYDRIFEQRAGREVGEQFDLAGTDEDETRAALPQILNPSKYAPEIAESLMKKNAISVAKQLLGDEAAYGGEHAILKPAGSAAETPWHQDEAYWDPAFAYNSMSIWIPLQPATLENGCMWFVPGSHRGPIFEHRQIGDDPRVHGLEVIGANVSSGVACPIPAGGCTIHHNATLHYTGPNRTDRPRRALIMILGLPGVRLPEPRDFPWQARWQTARQARAKAAETGG